MLNLSHTHIHTHTSAKKLSILRTFICAQISFKVIMGFFGDVISEVVGNSLDGGNDSPSDPPYVHPPWVARWDGEAGRWIYLNEETGERSWEKPVLEEAGESWRSTTILVNNIHATPQN